MPFKSKPPPKILFTQSLSTGRIIKAKYFIGELGDDAGKVIPIPQDERPARELPSGNELLNVVKQRELAAERRVLVKAGLGHLVNEPKPAPKPQAPVIPGMRPIGKLGEGRALYIPLPPWRRY